MDLSKLIKPEELTAFAENYNYKINGFKGQMLFPAMKTANLKVAYRQIANGQDIPVMAQVHALDTEARIGSRPTFKELELQKLLIKEKLDAGEKVTEYLYSLGGDRDGIVDYIFNDAANLLSRVITRTEVANMELLSTGQITVKENDLDFIIDYGFDKKNNQITLAGWSNADHDIIGDLNKIKDRAKKLGFNIVRAITSSTVLGYMTANKGIKAYFAQTLAPVTPEAVAGFVNNYFGIEFVAIDDMYKTDINGEAKRFFDENTITFVGTKGSLGRGLFGATPEELKLDRPKISERMLCTLTRWESEDPATTWVKATGMYLPVMTNINKMIIAKIN